VTQVISNDSGTAEHRDRYNAKNLQVISTARGGLQALAVRGALFPDKRIAFFAA
jgi:hypothetical protein